MTRPLSRAALAAFALLAAPLAAQHDAVLSGFEPTGAFRLTIDGAPQPQAKLYDNERAGGILVIASDFASPLLVEPGGVSALQFLKVYERADGKVDLLADAVLEPVAAVEPVGGGVRFTLGGKRVALEPAPNVLGRKRGAELLESNFEYRWRAKGYEPDPAALGRLRKERRDVVVLTFFGTWCGYCTRHLPLLLKVEQRLADAKLRFDFYGLPQQGLAAEPEAAKYRVDGVPTAIVLVGGKEVGRIPAAQWSNPESALDLILHPERAGG
jgi:thiol-disulfide isomerase/thioredoxin